MPLTLDSMILDILNQHPKSMEVFRKYGLGQIEDPSIRGMAAGASLETAVGYIGLSADQSSAMLKELNEIAGG